MQIELSDDQRAVLSVDIRLVEACPGAGKTRAIVARFSQLANATDRAIALVSFTNSAVDEAGKRCANEPQITQPPHFIGTFDRFIHRFIVTPVVTRERGKPPRYVDSWDDLSASHNVMARHRGINGEGLSLSKFHADSDGNLLYPTDSPGTDVVYVRQLEKAGLAPSDLTGRAQAMINGLTASGIYDSEQARLRALEILRNPNYAWLRDRIGTRFEELIVDEFQDCAAVEHDILNALEALGIRIVVVADPDQAIYEFRQASPSAYTAYYESQEASRIVHLNENHRSSPAICSLLSSLRSISKYPIVSVQQQSSDSPNADAVYVVSGTPAFTREQFDRLAGELDIAAAERLVLAATRAAAAALSGRPGATSVARVLTAKVLRNLAVLRHSSSATSRKDAIAVIETAIIGTLKFPPELLKASRDEQLEAAGLDHAQLRIIIGHLMQASTDWTSPEQAVTSIRQILKDLLAGLTVECTSTGTRFRAIDAAEWSLWENALNASAAENTTGVAGAHIHSVKGGECDAVLLEIEAETRGNRDHILELWKSQETSEARRVLYVGASRARRLLVLATPPRHVDSLVEIMETNAIPVEYLFEDS